MMMPTAERPPRRVLDCLRIVALLAPRSRVRHVDQSHHFQHIGEKFPNCGRTSARRSRPRWSDTPSCDRLPADMPDPPLQTTAIQPADPAAATPAPATTPPP